MTALNPELERTPLMMAAHGRHPAVTQLARFFAYDHLPPRLALISMWCSLLAETMIRKLPDGPELSTGLRKLLEAKDCFVRASIPTADEPE